MLDGVLICLAIAIFIVIYKSITANFDYFEKRNIKYMKPWTAFKITSGLFFKTTTAIEYVKVLYDAFPEEPISGYFDATIRSRPQYIVRDPEIIKRIAVKDFDHFEDHRLFANKKTDKMWGNSLFFMKGDEWRQMRSTLSPMFTGSKMRQMFELVIECADDVIKHFTKRIGSGEKINIEAKELFSQYTSDVTTSCAFGLKIDSLADPDNEFYSKSKEIMDFTSLNVLLRSVIVNTQPAIAKALNISILDKSIAKKFKDTILNTIEVRKKHNIFRPDMINLIMQIRQGTLDNQLDDDKQNDGFATILEPSVVKAKVNRVWTDDELVAQCFLFFLAGINTSSTMLTSALYELHINPQIQQKLYDEIVETETTLNGKAITYEVIQKMKYLDQVVCETLRKWPPNIQLDRVCVKDYVYNDGKLNFKVEKDKILFIPIYGIQNDPKYFPEPEKFDPERFNDANKSNIIPGTFLAFGIGPRSCIGSRFALMQIKTILYYLLLHFSFEPNDKTEVPIKYMKTTFSLLAENQLHLEIRLRKKL